MEFAITEEQLAIQDSVERFLADNCHLDYLRQATAEGATHDAALWRGLAELGMASLLVPEAHGGLGLDVLDAALVQETLGKYAAPVNFISNAVLAPLALNAAGSTEQQERWLPQLAAGKLNVAVGINEAGSGKRDGAGVHASDGRLSGRALFVLGSAGADLFLLGADDGQLHAVTAASAGVDITALTTIDDTQPVLEVNLTDVVAEPLPGSAETLGVLIDVARILFAADSLGASQYMLERAVAYSLERKQFGRQIGSFQAVKHLCAEMAAELEPSRSLLWYAAYSCSDVPEERSVMACHIKAHMSEISRFVARTATEVHGGMGFTDELGLHYWFKRIGFNRQILGGPEKTREDAARLQGWIN
ncbi:MAG: acyl-CoA/acyl-ACP dehydrogenase [Halioglobus sp.]|nr:acyl-CoA/acyl-ACP dehydrogenase [Halioglobus sp.]